MFCWQAGAAEEVLHERVTKTEVRRCAQTQLCSKQLLSSAVESASLAAVNPLGAASPYSIAALLISTAAGL